MEKYMVTITVAAWVDALTREDAEAEAAEVAVRIGQVVDLAHPVIEVEVER